MKRRTFLQLGTTGAGLLVARHSLSWAADGAAGGPFAHGVASGDPTPDGAVIWTRVTPDPAATPGSGVGGATTVEWQVTTADDPDFAHAASGSVVTDADRDHTVKIDVGGLEPGREHRYRFAAAGATSPVGRFRTAPADTADVANLRFGMVSCANWEGGHFSAYRHLAQRDDLDFVLHLGDYVYEYPVGGYGPGPAIGRRHDPAHEMVSLADYRRRHAQYKTDPALQALHHRYAFVCTWDDHEVTDNSYRDGAVNHQPRQEGEWDVRRAAAYQAFFEWMPVRDQQTSPGEAGRIYRRLRFGRLADLHMLDLRQYKHEEPEALPGLGLGSIDGATASDPSRTITGPEQMAWLKSGLASSATTWRLVGNPVMIAPLQFPALPRLVASTLRQLTGITSDDGLVVNTDQWDGYTRDRDDLLWHLHSHGIDNTTFLTGDIHSSWAAEVPLDAGLSPLSPRVATEMVGTSVTSDNLNEIVGTPDRTGSLVIETALQVVNRHIKMIEFDSHGYSVVDVTGERLHCDWWYVSDRTDPMATATFSRAYAVPSGTNRMEPARGPIEAPGARPTRRPRLLVEDVVAGVANLLR